MKIKQFVFNLFSENTFVLWDDTKDCVIIDPGCAEKYEREELENFIQKENLTVKYILLTHAHVDHIAGNAYVCEKFGVGYAIHPQEVAVLKSAALYGAAYGFRIDESPEPSLFLNDGDIFRFGTSELQVLYTPGHSPGEVCFVHHESKNVIAGDVIFQGSIGRTDLPGGNFEVLIQSIRKQILTLPEDYILWPGHGPQTTVNDERRMNPFLK